MKLKAIGSYIVRRQSERGLVVALPSTFTKDNQLEAGDPLRLFRVEGDDSLLIVKAGNHDGDI